MKVSEITNCHKRQLKTKNTQLANNAALIMRFLCIKTLSCSH